MEHDRVGDRRNDDREGAQGPASPSATEEMSDKRKSTRPWK
jgi:hypothetical protein